MPGRRYVKSRGPGGVRTGRHSGKPGRLGPPPAANAHTGHFFDNIPATPLTDTEPRKGPHGRVFGGHSFASRPCDAPLSSGFACVSGGPFGLPTGRHRRGPAAFRRPRGSPVACRSRHGQGSCCGQWAARARRFRRRLGGQPRRRPGRTRQSGVRGPGLGLLRARADRCRCPAGTDQGTGRLARAERLHHRGRRHRALEVRAAGYYSRIRSRRRQGRAGCSRVSHDRGRTVRPPDPREPGDGADEWQCLHRTGPRVTYSSSRLGHHSARLDFTGDRQGARAL